MADISWTFEDGTSEGWRFSNNGIVPTEDAPIVNGAIHSYDDHRNGPRYYSPAELAGDQSKLYGAVFSYRWRNVDADNDNTPVAAGVPLILTAQDGSNIYIYQDIPNSSIINSRTAAGEFSVTLQVPPVERNTTIRYQPAGESTYRTASEEEFRNVLSQFSHFSLFTDLRNGGDRFSLEDATLSPVCFTAGTLIETAEGNVPVEKLEVGTLVKTRDHGLQPIRWIGVRKLTGDQLKAAPKFRPIRIRAGAIGPDNPTADLSVSPQHRILIRSSVAQKMFDAHEILVSAKSLCEIEGIDVVEDACGVEYYHVMFDRHEIIFSNGAETESFYPGEQALKSVGFLAQQEIFSLFPELKDRENLPASIRPIVSGKRARKLLTRHIQNDKPLTI